MKDIIESIANALGLSHRIVDCYRYGRSCERAVSIAINNREAVCHLNDPDWVGLCLFAAYAKAEMAKRGWTLTRFDHPHRLAARMFDRMERTDPHLYDPTDPISVAEAELRCIADALQSNDQDQRGA